jgi:hypothetical protein
MISNSPDDWHTYEISFPGFFRDNPSYSKLHTAKTAGAAKYESYLEFSDAYDMTFFEFLKIITCRKMKAPIIIEPADPVRVEIANKLIQEISKRGRKFFLFERENRIAQFKWDGIHLWYVDKYSGVPLIMKKGDSSKARQHKRYFSEGGTLWGLVNDLKDYIFGDDNSNHNNGYGGLHSPHWGYPEEDMEAIREFATEIGYLKPRGDTSHLKFDMWLHRPEVGGIMCSFTDGKGATLETWFGSPPLSIDHVGPEYLGNRFANVSNEKHCEFIKRRYKEEITKFRKEDSHE